MWWVFYWIIDIVSVNLSTVLIHRGNRWQWEVYEGSILEQFFHMAIKCSLVVVVIVVPLSWLYWTWEEVMVGHLWMMCDIGLMYVLRALVRTQNDDFQEFLRLLVAAQENPTPINMQLLRVYDFDLWFWPCQFTHVDPETIGMRQWLCTPLSWLFKGVMVRVLYPGLVWDWIAYLWFYDGGMRKAKLDERRRNWVAAGGIPLSIRTMQNEKIGAMFLDHHVPGVNEELVICIEGNYGFYQSGLAPTPLSEGYSVLSFNRPGYGESSGVCYPTSEQNAAEAVFQYAVQELGFPERNIVLYGWSIGGYTASYLASQHPGIKGLILDGTFVDVLPVVLENIPWFLRWLEWLVIHTVRSYVDLRLLKWLRFYTGPITLIRRLRDEMMQEGNNIASNRINGLVCHSLMIRYPELFDHLSRPALVAYLGVPHVRTLADLDALYNAPVDISANAQANVGTPTLVQHLANRILIDVDGTHGQALPLHFFRTPQYHHQ